jgi:hypothetical protein
MPAYPTQQASGVRLLPKGDRCREACGFFGRRRPFPCQQVPKVTEEVAAQDLAAEIIIDVADSRLDH